MVKTNVMESLFEKRIANMFTNKKKGVALWTGENWKKKPMAARKIVLVQYSLK